MCVEYIRQNRVTEFTPDDADYDEDEEMRIKEARRYRSGTNIDC